MGPGMMPPPMGPGMMGLPGMGPFPMGPRGPFRMVPPPNPQSIPMPPPMDAEDRVEPPDPRVGRLQVCKDPKFNGGVPPPFAFEVQERKMIDGRVLEDILSREAYAMSAAELAPSQRRPPPEEVVKKAGVPFQKAVPAYEHESDIWNRKIELRSLDEAMRGDVSQPMARPVLFKEDYAVFREGKYVKDDCPIA